MRFLIKQISTSRTEIRIALNSIDIDGVSKYTFGSVGKTFDEGTIDNRYIPDTSANYLSIGPNPGIIRLVVAYLKDTLGTLGGFNNTILVTNDGKQHLPIVNIVVDDINLLTLNSETVPSLIIKLADKLPDTILELDEVSIQRQILTTQEQEVYFIPKSLDRVELRGLNVDSAMKAEVSNPDLKNTEYQNYNELTSSFQHSDKTVLNEIFSGSDPNLSVDYSKFENHVHFGSAVSKLENFKTKVGNIEYYLVQLSQSLATSSLPQVDSLRNTLFQKIQEEKNSFSNYEKALYYNGHNYGFSYTINLGKNYTSLNPLNNSTKYLNNSGFALVNEVSSSGDTIDLFKGKFNVEDKPFYNYSGSFYLSFLMKGDNGINGNIKWDNYQEEYIPKLPHDTLYTSSILQPAVTASQWRRFIYQASSSYWAPSSTNPIIGSPGSITDFTVGSSEVNIININEKTGSYAITLGGRYSNLATHVTSSGHSFTGSIVPAGELFRIYIDTSTTSELTSSYITDLKITKYDPSDILPFAEIHRTGSTIFQNWYDDQYESASLYDDNNIHTLMNNLPGYLRNDNQMDNVIFRKYVNLTAEYFDLIKNYIDNYILLFKNDDVDISADNLLPIIAKKYDWNFMLPFGKKEQGELAEYLGSTISDANSTAAVKNNIWRNVINNINYIYRTKGTKNSIRALLNSYGFPADILKIGEHGASNEPLNTLDNSALSDDLSNTAEALGDSAGNVSFTTKEDKIISYIIDNRDRRIHAEWRRDSVDADVIEFVFKPNKSTETQTILHSSGSGTDNLLWDVILESSASHNVKSRLQFRLNNTETGSTALSNVDTRVSMSTDWYDFRNQNFWNVLLQRTEGPSGSNIYSPLDVQTSHSYQLMVGEKNSDNIRTLQVVSMSFGGTEYTASATNWLGTGSRPAGDDGNLVIGENYTGSIAEFRTWKYPLSASKFKQHIFDKKSSVGNSATDSQTNLIYHYRLNENWKSGSIGATIKDTNISNLKDYSIDISNSALGHYALYDTDTYERIQFNVGIGGSFEISENNIIIDAERRFVDNLNPTHPSVLNLQDPLINKRKASSVIELVRSPQDVINDFISNQLGNFDFNDKFADPRDIYKPMYGDLETFAKDFFDYYNISLDINKYIDAQVNIFNQDLIKSIKRLVPGRAAFDKIGVQIKPTLLERQKLDNHRIEKTFIDIGPSEIKTKSDTVHFDSRPTEHIVKYPIDNFQPADEYRKGSIALHSTSGSYSGFQTTQHIEWHAPIESDLLNIDNDDNDIKYKERDTYNDVGYLHFVPSLDKTYDIHLQVASHTGSKINLVEELHKTHDIHFPVASHTGSKINLVEELYKTNDVHFSVASHTGSNPTLTEEYILPKQLNLLSVGYDRMNIIGEDKNNFFSYEPKLYKTYDSHLQIASHTGSFLDFKQELDTTRIAHFEISSHTGSTPALDHIMTYPHPSQLEVATHTGSNPNIGFHHSSPYTGFLDNEIVFRTKSGSLSWDVLLDDRNYHVSIPAASHSGSSPEITLHWYITNDAIFNYSGNDPLVSTFQKGFVNLLDSWGTSSEDVHFVHMGKGAEGKYDNGNTYHYEGRYVFNLIGDVETLSGSYTSHSSSFSTDFTGTITNHIFTASKDFKNQTFVKSDIGGGIRPLGTTLELRASSSIPPPYGEHFDELFVYPKNHQFIIGSSKDAIDTLTYKGTQNAGGEILESEAFNDLSEDAFYYVQTTGGSGYTIQYDA